MKVVWIWNLPKQSSHLSGALTALLGGPNQRSTGQSETPSAYRLCRPKYSHSNSPLVYVLLRVTPPPPCLLLFTAKFTAEAPKITDSLFGNAEKSEWLVKMPLLKGVHASGQCPIVPVSLKRWHSHWRGSTFRPILHILYTDGQCCVGVLPASIPKETHTGPGRKHTFYRLGEIAQLWHQEVIAGEEFLTVFKDMLNFYWDGESAKMKHYLEGLRGLLFCFIRRSSSTFSNDIQLPLGNGWGGCCCQPDVSVLQFDQRRTQPVLLCVQLKKTNNYQLPVLYILWIKYIWSHCKD